MSSCLPLEAKKSAMECLRYSLVLGGHSTASVITIIYNPAEGRTWTFLKDIKQGDVLCPNQVSKWPKNIMPWWKYTWETKAVKSISDCKCIFNSLCLQWIWISCASVCTYKKCLWWHKDVYFHNKWKSLGLTESNVQSRTWLEKHIFNPCSSHIEK